MADVEGALSLDDRRRLRQNLADTNDPFVLAIPKVELHVHIEGIITPELKWKFSQRNGMQLTHPRTGKVFTSLDELKAAHDTLKPPDEGRMDNAEETFSFFESYYGGFAVLKTKQDYYDLAMSYFERAAAMNVRYCELFFDPQGHTRTGVAWPTMMDGFRSAQQEAGKILNVFLSLGMLYPGADQIAGSVSLDNVLLAGPFAGISHGALRCSAGIPRYDRRSRS